MTPTIVRFSRVGQPVYGLVKGDSVFELTGDIYGDFAPGEYIAKYDELALLAPCVPGKIVGAGRNYKGVIEGRGASTLATPPLFLKAPSATIGPEDSIILPITSKEVVFEAELAVVIKRRAKRIPPSEAYAHVLGYTCANDVSDLDFPKHDARTKSFDTFCPLGPCIATGLDPGDRHHRL